MDICTEWSREKGESLCTVGGGDEGREQGKQDEDAPSVEWVRAGGQRYAYRHTLRHAPNLKFKFGTSRGTALYTGYTHARARAHTHHVPYIHAHTHTWICAEERPIYVYERAYRMPQNIFRHLSSRAAPFNRHYLISKRLGYFTGETLHAQAIIS